MPNWNKVSDWDILDMLDRFERQGYTASDVARHMSRKLNQHVTRSMVLSIAKRCRDAAGTPDKHDGTMKERWWDR